MKKTAFLGALAMAAAMTFGVISAEAVDVEVNGVKIETETPAVIMNDRTLVPLRAVSEALGCDVSWDADTQGITLTDGTSLYFTWIGRDHVFKTSATALQATSVMDAPPVIMNDSTMVPLRAISEMFGADVNWDADNGIASVNYEKRSVDAGLAAKYVSYEKVFDQEYDAYKNYADGTGNIVNAEITLANGGVIGLELYPDIAPVTVANFVNLANSGFYDGLIFHRVINSFMIQGGGFDENLNRKQADTIKGEFIANGIFNLIPHERGVISMARTSQDMDSASSQFFIMHDDDYSLNGQYAAFGRVISGMEYVNEIANTETRVVSELGLTNLPVENQVIKTITIK